MWKSELNRTLDFDLDQTNSYSTFTFVETSLSDLSSGQDYQLLVKLQDPHRLPKISAVPFKLTTRTMTEDEKHMMVVTVEASTKGSGARKAFDAGSIPMNDPIRLLPIVGKLVASVAELQCAKSSIWQHCEKCLWLNWPLPQEDGQLVATGRFNGPLKENAILQFFGQLPFLYEITLSCAITLKKFSTGQLRTRAARGDEV